MRGRKPKPIQMQILDGDTRKRGPRKLQSMLDGQIQAESGLPSCPRHLQGKVARATWKFWSRELSIMGLDKRPDAVMLEGACVAYGRAVEADQAIAKTGLMVRSASGVQTNPLIAISNNAWRNVRSFCSEFGLSPISRMRLSSEDGADRSGKDRGLLTGQWTGFQRSA